MSLNITTTEGCSAGPATFAERFLRNYETKDIKPVEEWAWKPVAELRQTNLSPHYDTFTSTTQATGDPNYPDWTPDSDS